MDTIALQHPHCLLPVQCVDVRRKSPFATMQLRRVDDVAIGIVRRGIVTTHLPPRVLTPEFPC